MLKSAGSGIAAVYPFERGSVEAFGRTALDGNVYDYGKCIELDGVADYAKWGYNAAWDQAAMSAGIFF